MEKKNVAKGRDLFVDEETCRRIHPVNSQMRGRYIYTREYLDSKGILYRHGFWSKKESDRLLENWQRFLDENPLIKEPLKLLEDGNSKAHHIFYATDFYLCISKSLNRSTYSCFTRLQRLVNREVLKTNKFSDKEDRKLKKYIKQYGRKYQLIARKMGRSRYSVALRYDKNLSKNFCKGKWSEEEDNLLLRALKDVTGIDNFVQMRFMKIPWKKVSKHIPSRNYNQCRAHFLKIKKCKLVEDFSKRRWKRKHSCQLVKKISEFEDHVDIDWNELYEDFKDVSPSPTYLQSRFYQIKSKISDFHRRDFSDIVEILKNKFLSK